MTLLFFLRSPAGSTDTGQIPTPAILWDHSDSEREQKKLEKEAKKLAKKKWDKAFGSAADKIEAEKSFNLAIAEAAKKAEQKRKRKRDEETVMLLFMHEFDGYDD